MPPPVRVAVVTDSTASLTAEDAARWGIEIVPLDVAADGIRYADGVDLTPDDLAALLDSGRRLTTSQPPPAAFAAVYEAAARRGAVEVVSVHLSGELSGTVRAAGLAAQLAPLPVHVVDTRSTGMGLGFAAIAAARTARTARTARGVRDEAGVGANGAVSGANGAGDAARVADRAWPDADPVEPVTGAEPATGAEVAAVADRVGQSTAAWFVVDSLEHLRRGGRLSGAAAAFGTVLGLRPVLTLREGRIEIAERVRTRRAARDRLQQLAVDEVHRRGAPVQVAVQHLGRPEVAADLAERVREAAGLDEVAVREVGAVLGGHLGIGVLAVMITDR